MILPDVNVLIYALRSDMPQHSACRSWLNAVISGQSRFGMSRMVLSAVVRITTNARIFREPSSAEEAFGFCEDLMAEPHCQIVEPGERHWPIFKRLCVETQTSGARVTDAWLAALAIEWDYEWVTLDRDYARFPGLKWRMPASA
jgi:toxin-antitoxin system PIN domain toxin